LIPENRAREKISRAPAAFEREKYAAVQKKTIGNPGRSDAKMNSTLSRGTIHEIVNKRGLEKDLILKLIRG